MNKLFENNIELNLVIKFYIIQTKLLAILQFQFTIDQNATLKIEKYLENNQIDDKNLKEKLIKPKCFEWLSKTERLLTKLIDLEKYFDSGDIIEYSVSNLPQFSGEEKRLFKMTCILYKLCAIYHEEKNKYQMESSKR